MKPLIAIVTCEKRRDFAAAQRATWVRDAKEFDVRFFLARQDREPLPDEVFLECGDGYEEMPEKVREICRWARIAGYRNLLKTDDDVALFPHRIQVPNVAYAGKHLQFPGDHWCSGIAYWLREEAIAVIADSELTGEIYEDRWVGASLFEHGIRLTPVPEIVFVNKSPHPQRPKQPNFAVGWWRENRTYLRRAYAIAEFAPNEMPVAYREFY